MPLRAANPAASSTASRGASGTCAAPLHRRPRVHPGRPGAAPAMRGNGRNACSHVDPSVSSGRAEIPTGRDATPSLAQCATDRQRVVDASQRLPGMEGDSEPVAAAFHGCRSEAGTGLAPADAWSSSEAVASPATVKTLASRAIAKAPRPFAQGVADPRPRHSRRGRPPLLPRCLKAERAIALEPSRGGDAPLDSPP